MAENIVGKAYDMRGKEIKSGQLVVWHDPETGRMTPYEVYGEPTEDMVSLWSKYGECEALPQECEVILDMTDIKKNCN